MTVCKQQIHQNSRLFTDFILKNHMNKIEVLQSPRGVKAPEVLLLCEPPTMVAVP